MPSLTALATGVAKHLRRWSTRFGRDRDDGILGPPVITWPARSGVRMPRTDCPNCDSPGPKPLCLTITFTTLPGSRRTLRLLRCPDCTCLFYSLRIPPDYAEQAMLGRGRVPFYLQQGAGLSLITHPLARLSAPAGSVYLEVGCGFGFGLDYARHAKGWNGRGIDPGGIAALGEAMLGVTIERRYLGEAEGALAGSCDVVMASETIEHVPSPIAFARVLRSLLRPGGTLILTTPDGAELRPDNDPSLLVPLLSPGLHLIFQTAPSLRALLHDAGFRHVAIDKDGHSLVAFAADRPPALESDSLVLRAEYRDYLERRAADFGAGDDLFLGFAGRALQEAANDQAFEQAWRVRALLEQGCIARFGSGLAALGARVAATGVLSLEALAVAMPLNLGGLLYADAVLRLASGEPRAWLGEAFRQAAAAAGLLRRALGDLAMDDGMTQAIAWTAHSEALLCAAAAGDADLLGRLSNLPAAPDKRDSARRRQGINERILVELVNHGHYPLARALCAATGLNDQPWSDPDDDRERSDSERDALFGLAILDSQSDQADLALRSHRRFQRLRQLLGAAPALPAGLYQAALQGEEAALKRRQAIAERSLVELVNEGNYPQAHELCAAAGLNEQAWSDPACDGERSDSERDALFCLAVLDSQSDQPALILRSHRRFQRLRQLLGAADAPGVPAGLYQAALRGEQAALDRLTATPGIRAGRADG